MKKILFFISIVSLVIFSGCRSTVSVDTNAEKQIEESDTYVPWWVTNPSN